MPAACHNRAGPRLARRLPPWHWIRVARLLAPRNPNLRAVLFALHCRMDPEGMAYPSQELIAADTGLSERTVRSAVLDARRSGWLAVATHARPGKAWRLSFYAACIPDEIDLRKIDLGRDVDLAKIADQWLAKHGQAEDELHGRPIVSGEARPAKGAAAIAARKKQAAAAAIAGPSAGNVAATVAGAANPVEIVRQDPSEGAAKRDEGAADPVASCGNHRRLSISEGSIPKVPSEVNTQEGRALARTTAPEWVVDKRTRKSRTPEELHKAIEQLRAVNPGAGIDYLASSTRATVEEVNQALEARGQLRAAS